MSDQSKWLGPEEGYTNLLDARIQEEIDREFVSVRKWNPLRPSNSGGCPRCLGFQLAEYRLGWKYDEAKKKSVEQFRLLRLGYGVEYSTIQNFAMLKDFTTKYKQQAVTLFEIARGKPGLPNQIIEGSCDWVLMSEKHRCICDAKSKKDGGMGAYRYWLKDIQKLMAMQSVTKISDTEIWVDDLPAFIKELNGDFLTDNMLQLNGYACSSFFRERGVDHGLIYRYNKNTSEHFAIRFRPSLDVHEQVRQKFEKISIAVDKEDLDSLECICELGTMRAAYCDFAAYCNPGVDVKAEFFNKGRKPKPTSTGPKIKRVKKGDA